MKSAVSTLLCLQCSHPDFPSSVDRQKRRSCSCFNCLSYIILISLTRVTGKLLIEELPDQKRGCDAIHISCVFRFVSLFSKNRVIRQERNSSMRSLPETRVRLINIISRLQLKELQLAESDCFLWLGPLNTPNRHLLAIHTYFWHL